MEKAKKRMSEHKKTVPLATAPASTVLKPQQPMASGMMKPPPPIPPTLAKPMIMGRVAMPIHSLVRMGKMLLC